MAKRGFVDPHARERGRYSLAMELLAHKAEEVSYLKEVLAAIASRTDVSDSVRDMAHAGIAKSAMVALGLADRAVDLSAQAPNQCQPCAAP